MSEPTQHPSAQNRLGSLDQDDRLSPEVKTALTVLIVATFVVILNETIMNVAVPRLMVDLGITAVAGQWLTTGFMLTMAVVIPVTGLLLQALRTRTAFLLAMGLFTTGTALAALAPGFGVLLTGRVVQAAGTAIMIPLLMTTAMTFVPVSRRGRTMGLISIVISVAPAVGPTISGLILHVLPWRWLFLLVLPIAAGALVLGAMTLRNIGEPRRVSVDALSIVLTIVGFGGLVYGLSAIGAAASGGSAVNPAAPLAVGVVGLGLFIWRQISLQRSDAALLDLRPFTVRTYTVSVILVVFSSASLFGVLILLPLFIQNVLGYETLEAGLMMLPGGLAMGVASEVVGRLYDKVGPRPLVLPGAVVVSASLWIMTSFGMGTQVWVIVAAHVLLSVGLAFMFTPLMTNSLGSLPKSQYSYGSAILTTLQQVAGAAGTAMFITVMALGAAAASTTPGVRDAADPAVAATASGIHTAFLVGAVLSLVSIALAPLVRPAPEQSDEAGEAGGAGEAGEAGGAGEAGDAGERGPAVSA